VEVSVNAHLKGPFKHTPGSQVPGTVCVPFYNVMDPTPARRTLGMLRKSSHFLLTFIVTLFFYSI
jgi:hypothetical protein